MGKVTRKQASTEPEFYPNVRRMAALADEHKALDVKAYDVRGLTIVADSFVICGTSSEPQFKAVYNAVREGMKTIGMAPLHSEGSLRGHWLVIDYGDIIFHVFREEAREFYDLDGLWGDAPKIDLHLEG